MNTKKFYKHLPFHQKFNCSTSRIGLSKNDFAEYKKLGQKFNVIYKKINRLNGFIDEERMLVPSWFQNNESTTNKPIIEMTDIDVGDYVVHRDYGIGKFVGLKHINDSNFSLLI